jgi:hypothetical protein
MFLRKFLKSKSTLAHLKPPPVLPAQAPTTISSIRIALEKVGHISKSQDENPVVVIMLDTWKKECLSVVPRLAQVVKRFTVIAITLATTIPT